MLFRIAARLGRTVDELECGTDAFRPLTYPEFVEWCAFFGLENRDAAGIDPNCPFEPGTLDYEAFHAFRNLGT